VSRLTLFGYWRSSATWRVRIGLHIKAVPFEYVPVHLVRDGGEQHGDAHARRNPMAQVPVVSWSDGGGVEYRLTQSLAILEFLDEVWSDEPPLLPRDPFARARSRQLAELVNAGIQPFQNLWLTKVIDEAGADGRDIARRAIARGLDALEAELELAGALPEPARPGVWLVGGAPSLADLCAVPQLYNARRFGLEMARWPRLTRMDQVAASHPAFLAAHPDAQPDAVPANP
jgi:maleylpyruvate isomerase